MRAHQIMARHVITVGAETSILDAAKLMMEHHVSGLPVVDGAGRLVGMLSESDFLRRSEIGTQRRRPRWLVLPRFGQCSDGLCPRTRADGRRDHVV